MDTSESQGLAISNDEMRRRLLGAAWLVLTYEVLKSEVIDRTRDLYRLGRDNEGWVYDPRYDEEVRSLKPRDLLAASLEWLKQRGILDHKDVADFYRVRGHRNDLAHNLVFRVMQAHSPLDRKVADEAARLVTKLGRHWARTAFPLSPFAPVPADKPDVEVFSSTMMIVGVFAELVGLIPGPNAPN